MINPFEQIFCSEVDQPGRLVIAADRVRLPRVCLPIGKDRRVVASERVPEHVVEVTLEDLLCCALLTKDGVEGENLSLVYPDRV